MKTGNPKQAAILGIVAVGALGFLGSSLFSTFAAGSTPPVQEVRAPQEPAASTAKLPENEPGDNAAEGEGNEFPPKIENSPFKATAETAPPKPEVAPAKPDRKPTSLKGRPPRASDSGEEGGLEPTDPFGKGSPTLPPTEEMPPGGGDSPSKPDAPKPIMIKFEGYVDAGNPVAIIRIGESQYTADQGEGLPNGIRVIAITAEKLTLSIRGRQKSIWIGREVQL